MARWVRSSSKWGERMRSKWGKGLQGGVKASDRAFDVRSSSSRRKNSVELLSSSCFVPVSEGRRIH